MTISRGIILVIVGIVLFFPASIGFQMILPFPYGIVATLGIGPSLIIVGVIFLIKDRANQDNFVFKQGKFCTKCGSEMSAENAFCSKCGTKSS